MTHPFLTTRGRARRLPDIGANGKPVGYDIQYASTRKGLIARRALGEEAKAA